MMSSISLDSDRRSASAALFVQGISTPISRQDMGSAVYHRGYAKFLRKTQADPRQPRLSERPASTPQPQHRSPAAYPQK